MMLHFVAPAWLFGLLLMPLLGLIHWQTVQRERDALQDFAAAGALAKMGVRPGADVRLWRGLLALAAIACALVALAQPRWGASGAEGVQAREGSLIVALDVSKSMRAHDMNEESRMKAAQGVLDELLPKLAGWRVGVVAFAGEAEAVCPLTSDHEAVRTLLARAKPGGAAGQGSNVEAGLRAAIPLFTSRPGGPERRLVLLISDGEELGGDADAAIAALREARVTLHALGVGTAEGAPIPGEPDVWGNPTWLTYRGEQVVTKLDAGALKRLADGTGGAYMPATDPLAGEAIATKLGAGVAGQASAAVAAAAQLGDQPYELFQIPLALALLLALAEAALALAGRPRPVRRFADVLRVARGGPATAVLLAAVATSTGGWTWYPAWLPNGEAGQAYQAGDLPKAEALLRGALEHDPANFRLKYNLGNVLYEKGNLPEAEKVYQEALTGADEEARPVVRYNLGNVHFRQAEKAGDPKGYEQAIADYEAVLASRPADADARHNLEVARERLKRSKRENQKPQAGNQGQSPNSGQGQGGPLPVGVQSRYRPPPPMRNLPSQAEVDALLRALEADERQRQAEQATEPPPGSSGDGPNAQNLLEQALGGLDMQKDW